MRFIRGESLENAIEEFHAAGPAERMLRLRGLLRRIIEVANAVAYAHSRGVLHRDLKPANIMLGPYGETLVVDWGLAKPVDRPEAVSIAAESRLLPPAAHDSDMTGVGRAIGTPAYMSPEQAAGAVDLIGRASDIYSLGATLYSLLTGAPPFQGRDVDSIRQKVLRGEFARPRAVAAWVSRPLEAICLKAMALEPFERYRSARALAEDVERWLTRQQYERFLAETRGEAAVRDYQEAVAERSPAPWQPAEAFNWFDAVRFCRWLTTAAGLPEGEQCYDDPRPRLANESRRARDETATGRRAGQRPPWEYACRSGTVTAFSFGSDVDLAPRFGWFQANSQGAEHSLQVLRPNLRGLRNMHGNNSEWCHDWLAFDPGPEHVDPIGPPSGQCRVVRGGSYLSRPALARSASRGGLPPDFASPSAGFRFVRTLSTLKH